MAVDATGGSTYGRAYQAAGLAADQRRLQLKILSPYETYFVGQAVSVTASNQSGRFDILAGHANFFSLVDGGTVVVETGFQRLEFPIARGILRVHGDEVTLFANI